MQRKEVTNHRLAEPDHRVAAHEFLSHEEPVVGVNDMLTWNWPASFAAQAFRKTGSFDAARDVERVRFPLQNTSCAVR